MLALLVLLVMAAGFGSASLSMLQGLLQGWLSAGIAGTLGGIGPRVIEYMLMPWMVRSCEGILYVLQDGDD